MWGGGCGASFKCLNGGHSFIYSQPHSLLFFLPHIDIHTGTYNLHTDVHSLHIYCIAFQLTEFDISSFLSFYIMSVTVYVSVLLLFLISVILLHTSLPSSFPQSYQSHNIGSFSGQIHLIKGFTESVLYKKEHPKSLLSQLCPLVD